MLPDKISQQRMWSCGTHASVAFLYFPFSEYVLDPIFSPEFSCAMYLWGTWTSLHLHCTHHYHHIISNHPCCHFGKKRHITNKCLHLFSHPTSYPIKYRTPIILDNFLTPHTKTWHTSSTATYTVIMLSPSPMQQGIPMHLVSKHSKKSSNILTEKDTSQVWKWGTMTVSR